MYLWDLEKLVVQLDKYSQNAVFILISIYLNLLLFINVKIMSNPMQYNSNKI